ncbi:MAG: hypothetical protein ACR2G0_13615 [Chthoniobacterales bacterium]
MTTVMCRPFASRMNSDEVRGLQQALDLSYARLRERARREWQRCTGGIDPSDACVRVRIHETARPTLAL